MLGYDWLAEHKAQWNFGEKALVIRGVHIPLLMRKTRPENRQAPSRVRGAWRGRRGGPWRQRRPDFQPRGMRCYGVRARDPRQQPFRPSGAPPRARYPRKLEDATAGGPENATGRLKRGAPAASDVPPDTPAGIEPPAPPRSGRRVVVTPPATVPPRVQPQRPVKVVAPRPVGAVAGGTPRTPRTPFAAPRRVMSLAAVPREGGVVRQLFANPPCKAGSPARCPSGDEERLEKAHELAREHLKVTASRLKDYYDRKVHVNRFNVGDQVHVLNLRLYPNRCPKWVRRYADDAIVVKRINDVTYQLKSDKWRNKFRICHVDKLKMKVPFTDVAAPAVQD
jgi:hypothetical protein